MKGLRSDTSVFNDSPIEQQAMVKGNVFSPTGKRKMVDDSIATRRFSGLFKSGCQPFEHIHLLIIFTKKDLIFIFRVTSSII